VGGGSLGTNPEPIWEGYTARTMPGSIMITHCVFQNTAKGTRFRSISWL
jgi:hypothetical protein